MQKKVIWLDLDGTLADLSALFAPLCIMLMARRFMPIYGPFGAVRILKSAYGELISNTSESPLTNYDRMIKFAKNAYKGSHSVIDSAFDTFYQKDFVLLKKYIRPVEGGREAMSWLIQNKFPLYLATNPIWPIETVKHRLDSAGYKASDFVFISHSKIMHYCKPNVQYFVEFLKINSLMPENVIFIGDNEKKDGHAKSLGIKTFILGKDKKNSWAGILKKIECL